MTGLELSRNLYENVFRAVLREEFPALETRIAVGLAGPGSECFGFDDEVSRDHDFGPRLCLWLTKEDAETFGPRLQARYRELTRDLAEITPQAEDRSGVISIPEFYMRFTGRPGAPEDLFGWLRVADHYLATATNGEVFRDDLGEFTAIRRKLLEGYPEDVRRKKLAARLYVMGQAGQYNLPRSLRRGDEVASVLALSEFLRAALQAVYLLNRRYAPYYKWLYRGARELPRAAAAVTRLGLLPDCPAGSRPELTEEICRIILAELQAQELTEETDDFLVTQAFAVAAGIKDPRLAELDVSIG